MRDVKLMIFAATIVSLMIIGEIYIYTFDEHSTYGVGSSASSEDYSYNVHSGISNRYDVVISDNGEFKTPREYYIYYDSSYGAQINEINHPIGSKELDQSYYISQLVRQLENRGVSAKVLNAIDLYDMVREDLIVGNTEKGLIVLSGALPDKIYKGAPTDPVFLWMDIGGCLYWAGNLLGAYYSEPGGVVKVGTDYQNLFFGSSNCLNDVLDKAYSDDTSNGYRYALSLSNHSVKYSVDVSKISAKHITLGYTEGGYSSITLMERGNGMICMVAGDYSNEQRADLSQVIGAHLCYDSELIAHEFGVVTRSTVVGNTEVSPPAGYSAVFIYLGGYYLEYARCNVFYGTDIVPID